MNSLKCKDVVMPNPPGWKYVGQAKKQPDGVDRIAATAAIDSLLICSVLFGGAARAT